jgi:hypothetical protein
VVNHDDRCWSIPSPLSPVNLPIRDIAIEDDHVGPHGDLRDDVFLSAEFGMAIDDVPPRRLAHPHDSAQPIDGFPDNDNRIVQVYVSP